MGADSLVWLPKYSMSPCAAAQQQGRVAPVCFGVMPRCQSPLVVLWGASVSGCFALKQLLLFCLMPCVQIAMEFGTTSRLAQGTAAAVQFGVDPQDALDKIGKLQERLSTLEQVRRNMQGLGDGSRQQGRTWGDVWCWWWRWRWLCMAWASAASCLLTCVVGEVLTLLWGAAVAAHGHDCDQL